MTAPSLKVKVSFRTCRRGEETASVPLGPAGPTAIARRIAGWLDISTPKQDNISAAEAVMIVDVMGTTDTWEKAQAAITGHAPA